MGQWNINIQGVCMHGQESRPVDPDLLAMELVKTLSANGHIVESATFTLGAKIDLIEAVRPKSVRVVINGDEWIVQRVVAYETVVAIANVGGDRPSMTPPWERRMDLAISLTSLRRVVRTVRRSLDRAMLSI